MTNNAINMGQPADMDALLSRAVQKDLTNGAPQIWGACLAYDVPAGWAAETLKDDVSIAVVKDSLALKAALNSAKTVAVFVPLKAALTEKTIKNVCIREGQAKIIYTEVNNNE